MEELLPYITAVIGFAGKAVYDRLVQRKDRFRNGMTALKSLESLLKASKALFIQQGRLRNRLQKMLEDRIGPEVKEVAMGYNNQFAYYFDKMLPAEKDLFDMVRAITENSMYEINKAMYDWSMTNTVDKLFWINIDEGRSFDNKLSDLRLHLTLWLSRYNSVFKSRQDQSLVYLGDEHGYGVGFPPKMDEALAALLSAIRIKQRAIFDIA